MRKFFLLCAAAILATGFSANNAQAQLGLGYLHSDAPVGIYYDLDGSYLALGVGFNYYDLPSGSTSTETSFRVAGSWMMDMKSGDGWGFGPSIGAMFRNDSPKTGDSASWTTISVGLMGHWDPTANVSFWMGHGLDIVITSPPVGDSTTDFMTNGVNIADLGFTWWLP